MQDFPKARRLCSRDSITQLFQEGAKGSAGKILVRALPAPDGAAGRVAAVAGKKLGCAVVRNRMRRRLRAAYRTGKEKLPEGWDMALVARPGLLEAAWQDVKRDMELAAARAVKDFSGRRPSPPRP